MFNKKKLSKWKLKWPEKTNHSWSLRHSQRSILMDLGYGQRPMADFYVCIFIYKYFLATNVFPCLPTGWHIFPLHFFQSEHLIIIFTAVGAARICFPPPYAAARVRTHVLSVKQHRDPGPFKGCSTDWATTPRQGWQIFGLIPTTLCRGWETNPRQLSCTSL